MGYNKKTKGKRLILILFMMMFSYVLAESKLIVSAKEDNIIRVAYPEVENFTEVENGIYSGYGYEYLREIAKFTGWEYEFIEVSLNDSIEMLMDGRVDIAGSVIKNNFTETYYEFPQLDAGNSYTTLAVSRNNTTISDSNYETLNGITVGVFDTATTTIQKFEEFCKNNNLTNITIKTYESTDESILNLALANNEVDAILGNDLLVQPDQRIALKFSPTPFYFATTKGNTDVLNGLNYGLSMIEELEPDYDDKLREKYFKQNTEYVFSLTNNELSQLEEIDTLRAVYIDSLAPIQYFDERTKRPKGIAVEVIQQVANTLGITIEWVRTSNYSDALMAVKTENADVFIAAPNNYTLVDKYGISLTKSYLSLPTATLTNTNAVKTGAIAVPKSYSLQKIVDSPTKILTYNTLEECINAVEEGLVDYTFGNFYALSPEIQERYYQNIKLIYNHQDDQLNIGVGEHIDTKLLSIINKAILGIPEDDIYSILYNNVLSIKNEITVSSFIHTNLPIVLGIVTIITIIIIGLIYTIFRLRLSNERNLNQLLRDKAKRDSLTGLYNCGTTEKLTSDYINDKTDNIYGAFLLIDIDNFKQLNDTLGHNAGDMIIKEVSKKMSEIFDTNAIIGRLGGDEFELLIKDIPEDNLELVSNKAKDLCEQMDRTITSDSNEQVHISVSIGICLFKKAFNFTDVYVTADKALYQVKRSGRNNYYVTKLD